MLVLYIILAIILLVVGHIIKSFRWKQLISIYEDVNANQLLLAMSIGQAINMVLPYRLGDIFRIWRVGKKNLDNGYVLAMVTVLVDIFIDTVTIGMAFTILYILGIHKDIVAGMAFGYGILSILVMLFCIVAIMLKKYIKCLIQKIASLFNLNIERKILMGSYTLLVSMKDIFKKDNILKIIFYTICVWGCYFLSYGFFAIFLQGKGYNFTLTGVFKTIFSMSGDALFIECIKIRQDTSWLLWFGLYLIIPLILTIGITFICKNIDKCQNNIHKSNRIIPQVNAMERLAFLNIYFNGDNREYFDSYLSINKDVSVLRDCSAGSNATTILAMNKEFTFYRKYAFGKDAKKLSEQIEWIENCRDYLPVCNIINKGYENNICYYDMEYLSNALGFFQYIHTVPLEQSWKVLNEVLDSLNQQLYSKTEKKADLQIIKEYVNKKVEDNIAICNQWCKKYYNTLFSSSIVYINGSQYKNLKYYEKYFNVDYLSKVFYNDTWAKIHGDLTIENIVCIQGTQPAWYLIDPNTGSMHETPYLDYAKLLQSLHGKYEFLMMVNDVQVNENSIEFMFTSSIAYQKLYEQYKSYLFNNFSTERVKSIFYHEAIHWLRLMPYKIRKNPHSAIIFYAGMLMVFSDIEKIFESKNI